MSTMYYAMCLNNGGNPYISKSFFYSAKKIGDSIYKIRDNQGDSIVIKHKACAYIGDNNWIITKKLIPDSWTVYYSTEPYLHKYLAVHDNYDGAPDGNNHLIVFGNTIEELFEAIEEIENDSI